ncbi:uncharacterized protein LOC128625677 isoform X2 [Ictalurus furcatus]|uniref:uncharacterized protein LOC128625677 isoform X2 n=1 Tax=Ictalurus furcatus TaxID=66913 RepID=UPI002350CAA0|nr:uncharacterized protein LOC128625677 isoform X2 [Ictalurus furcatus]
MYSRARRVTDLCAGSTSTANVGPGSYNIQRSAPERTGTLCLTGWTVSSVLLDRLTMMESLLGLLFLVDILCRTAPGVLRRRSQIFQDQEPMTSSSRGGRSSTH